MRRRVCRKAQMSHQLTKMRRNFPMDSGDLAKRINFCVALQEF